jgi:hypothetical protein
MTQMYCYVADMLGFKSMILNLPVEKQANRVTDWIQFVSEGINKFNIDNYQLVSDTIFAGTEDSEEGLKKLLSFSKYMLENGIKKSFLLRGAISYGEVTWDAHISYGKAIVDAYNLANDMDWIGTACLSTVVHEDSSLWTSGLIVQYVVPMKKGDVISLPTVIWNIPTFTDLMILTTSYGLFPEGHNPIKFSYYNKIQNTALYSHYIKTMQSRKLPLNEIYGFMPLQLAVSNVEDIESIRVERMGRVERSGQHHHGV